VASAIKNIRESLQVYNCAVRLPEKAMPERRDDLLERPKELILLPGVQEALQAIQKTEWMHSPRF
jgi:hypothetical protein